MKTIEAAKIIIANAETRDNAIIAKQGMTGIAWNWRHINSTSMLIESIADDVIRGLESGSESANATLRKIAKTLI